MKYGIVCLLLFMSLLANAQWQNVNYVNKLSFDFPGSPDILDTLNTRTYYIQQDSVILFINISRDPEPGVVKGEAALEAKYDSVMQSMFPRLGNYRGTMAETVNFHGYKARHFKALTDAYQRYHHFETYTVLVGDEFYQFNALSGSEVSGAVQRFYDSVQFGNSSGDTEKSTTNDNNNSRPFPITYILGGMVLLAGLVWFFRRKGSI